MNELLLGLADDELIIGWRDSEWTGIAPMLEEDVAFSSIAQNEIGHARAVYELLSRTTPTRSRSTASRRSTAARRSSSCTCSTGAARSRAAGSTRSPTRSASAALMEDGDARSPGSRRRSTARRRTTACTRRCGASGWRTRRSSARRSTSCGRTRSACCRRSSAMRSRRGVEREQVDAVERGTTRRGVHGAARRDDDGAPLGAGGRAMVTAEQVWEAFEEIPDPEIPVISLVDLGVIRSVDVRDGHVQVEFTPTFLGCPALEVMKRALEETVAALGGEPDVQRDPGRLVVDRQDHAPPAARSCAQPASRRPHRAKRRRRSSCSCSRTCSAVRTAARRETKLENIFGPTPCRSLRYCESCRQPFEQFKTI